MPDRSPAAGSPELTLRDELFSIALSLTAPPADAAADETEPVVVPWPHEPRTAE